MKNEQITDLQRKSAEAAIQLVRLSIENAQRILSLQSELAQDLFKDGVAAAKSFLEARDAREMFSLQTRYSQEMAQKLVAATQKASAVGDQAREQLSRLMTEQLVEGGDLKNPFRDAFKLPPGGAADFAEVIQQAMATANQAFGQMAKASSAVFTNLGETAKRPGKKAGKQAAA